MPIPYLAHQKAFTKKDEEIAEYVINKPNFITLKDGSILEKPLTVRHDGLLYVSGEVIKLAYKFAKNLFRGEKGTEHFNPYTSCDVIVPLKKHLDIMKIQEEQLEKMKNSINLQRSELSHQIKSTEETINKVSSTIRAKEETGLLDRLRK